jgi:probable O-glycosylation ligase (exosortase A-associated)
LRDLLVTALFFYGAIKAFRHPYFAALLWVWIGLMNPHRLGWGFAHSVPFAMVAFLVMAVSMFMHPKEVKWPRSGPLTVFILFAVWVCITTVFAIHVPESVGLLIATLKMMLVTLMIATIVRTREEILGLVVVIAVSIGFFGVKGGFFTLSTGGAFRVWGPPSSVIEDNNELAVALIITIPLLYYLILQKDKLVSMLPFLSKVGAKWLKRMLLASIALCAVSALGSHSRGALLAIVAMSSMLWWRSKSKLTVGLVLLILSPAIILFMPEEWTSRMSTIKTYDEDSSAMGRLNAWTMAINIANSRLMGAGFANDSPLIYQMYAPDPNFVIVAHSIYFQVLGQHGYIGLGLYLLFWILTYRTAGRLMTKTRERPEWEWVWQLAGMIKVSIVGFAVGGAFLSLAFWDMPFYFMVVLVVSEKWVDDRLYVEAGTGQAQSGVREGAGRTGVAS